MSSPRPAALIDESKWPHANCPYIFTKYIKDKKQDYYSPLEEIDFVFKDIAIQFDLEDYEDILKDAKQSLSDRQITKKDFEVLLQEWVMLFKEEVSSNLISECLDVIQEKFQENEEDLGEVLKQMARNGQTLTLEEFPEFVKEIMPILEVRIVNLTTKKPLSDENVCDDKDETEFLKAVADKAKKLGFSTIDINTAEKVLIDYFKGIDAKYCFNLVKIYDDEMGIDPFDDMGENNPFAQKNKEEAKKDQMKIDETQMLIEDAEAEGEEDKVKLLKKLKHFYEMKKETKNQKDRDALDLQIASVEKQLRGSKNPTPVPTQAPQKPQNVRMSHPDYQNQRYENPNYDDEEYPAYNKDIEYSDDSGYYQNQPGKTPSPYPENPKSSTRGPSKLSSQPGNEIEKRLEAEPTESLEERRSRGIKEIFDFYTRQQLLIGRKATFEQIEHELSNLNMGEFMRFCKDFKIPVSKTRCAEVFKKTAVNSKEMFIEQFNESFSKLMAMRNKEELEGLEKRLREVKKLITKRKKKLEVDEVEVTAKPTSKDSHKRADINSRETRQRSESREQKPVSKEQNRDQNIGSSVINSKVVNKVPVKSMGGDPHGAVAKMQEKQIEELKKEMAQVTQKVEVKKVSLK